MPLSPKPVSSTMSRRRSRLPPPVSSDRELDEFLKWLVIRTPRTPRNKRISPYQTPASRGRKHYLNPIVEEADFILETLAAVEREEKLQKKPIGKSFTKTLRNLKRVSSEDSEWDSLMTKGKSKRRRKHYVVLNSLPLSQDLRNDRFQFTQSEAESWPRPLSLQPDPIAHTLAGEETQRMAYTSSGRPLFPVSAIRSMITSPAAPWSKGELNSTRLPNKSGCAERAIPRNKPGSGFDWVGDDELITWEGSGPVDNNLYSMAPGDGSLELFGYSMTSLKHKILHLPPVPEAASPSLTGFEMKSMAEHSKQTSIKLKLAAKNRKADDYALILKKTRAAMTIKYPELRFSRNLDTKINALRSFGALGAQEPDLLTHKDTGACQSVKENWCSRFQATPPASDVVEIMENPHDTSRMSGICLNDSPPAFTYVGPERQQTEVGALRPLLLLEKSPERTSVSTITRNILGRANTKSELGELYSPLPVTNYPKRSHVYDRQPPTYLYQPAGSIFTNGDEDDENKGGEGPAPSITRRRSISTSPDGSYFSTALRVLGNNLGRGVKCSPAGYLNRSALEPQYFPITNYVITEKEQDIDDCENLVAGGTVPIGIYNLNCTKLSISNRGPTTPVALKDLLSRPGSSITRRPSISGIFRDRRSSRANLKPSRSNNQKPTQVMVQDTGFRVASATGPLLLPNTSGRESVYTLSGPRELVVNNESTIPGMPPRPEVLPRTRFKPPLLDNKTLPDNKTNVLLDNDFGTTRAIARKLKTKPFGRRRELDMESPKIDIKRIASFVAVQEAW